MNSIRHGKTGLLSFGGGGALNGLSIENSHGSGKSD